MDRPDNTSHTPIASPPPASTARWGRSALAPLITTATSLAAAIGGYRPSFLRGDALAAITVSLVAIPQCMAFAALAGLPPVHGLYTAVVVTLVGCLLTGSIHLHFGVSTTMSLLTTSAFVALSVPESGGPLGSRVQIAAMLAMLAGLIQLAFAFGRLGELVRFVSRSVIVGLSAGAGVLIAIGQIPAFFGIDLAGTHSPYEAAIEKTHRIVQAFTQHGASISRPALIVGCVSLVVALLCGKISRWLPKHLLAIAAGVLTVYLAGWTSDDLKLVGTLPTGLPEFSPPPLNWHAYRPLLGPAFAIALVGMIEVCGISKSLAAQDPHAPAKPIDPGQEFVAIGIANVAGSCFSCMPSSGSYSRSALNQESGARSRFAGVASAIITAALFLLAAPAASAIPMASIAAILFVIAAGLINVDYIRRLVHSNRADLWVCLATFFATLVVALEVAVFAGIFLTLALYLRRARHLYITQWVGESNNTHATEGQSLMAGWQERPLPSTAPCTTQHAVSFLQIEGNLFFASADDLQDRFLRVLAQKEVRVLILRLKRTHMVDATIMHVIESFALRMAADNRHLILCGLRPRMRERMAAFGLEKTLGADNFFVSNSKPFSAAKAAIHRAQTLVHAAPSSGVSV